MCLALSVSDRFSRSWQTGRTERPEYQRRCRRNDTVATTLSSSRTGEADLTCAAGPIDFVACHRIGGNKIHDLRSLSLGYAAVFGAAQKFRRLNDRLHVSLYA